jgi:hypothetical protein
MHSSDSVERRARFFNLVDDVCRELDQPVPVMPDAPADVPLTMGIEVDRMRFELTFLPEEESDLLLDCVVGACPDDEEMLLALLKANVDLLRDEQGSFSLWREQNVVVFSTSFADVETDGARLAEALRALSLQAAAWRDGLLMNASVTAH